MLLLPSATPTARLPPKEVAHLSPLSLPLRPTDSRLHVMWRGFEFVKRTVPFVIYHVLIDIPGPAENCVGALAPSVSIEGF